MMINLVTANEICFSSQASHSRACIFMILCVEEWKQTQNYLTHTAPTWHNERQNILLWCAVQSQRFILSFWLLENGKSPDRSQSERWNIASLSWVKKESFASPIHSQIHFYWSPHDAQAIVHTHIRHTQCSLHATLIRNERLDSTRMHRIEPNKVQT